MFRIAVIGSTGRGDYGHKLDEVWLKVPDAKLVGVADEDKPGLAKAAQRLGGIAAYSDYRKMLDEQRPDIVSICPRWVDRHAEMVIAAAERGIHVYLEKPLCPTLADADAMVAACERSHVKLALALQTRHSPKLPVIASLLAEGRLGRILELRGRGKEDQRGGGEDLWVLGTHVLDLARNLAGEPQWCQAAVLAGDHAIEAADVKEGAEGLGLLAGDAVHAMYGLDKGPVVYFDSVRQAAGRPSRFGLAIYGTKGVLEFETGYLPPVRLLEDSHWTARDKKWQDVSSAGVGKPEPLKDLGLDEGNRLAVLDLMAAITDDRQPKVDVYAGRAAVEMIAAAFASQVEGRRVNLPLTKRTNPLMGLL